MNWLLWMLACGSGPAETPERAPDASFEPLAGAVRLVEADCDPCARLERVDRALIRAGGYLADHPAETRFDAAIAVHEIREVVDHPDLARAWERVRAVADEDADHLHRRFWAEIEVPATNEWTLPEEGRPKVNAVVAEALWCDRFPIRDATLAYLADGMLDEGGYWSTHAAWTLSLAHERGCVGDERFATLAAPIVSDLASHQPDRPEADSVAAVDLFAERLLGLLWLGHTGPEVERSVDALVARQHDDGGWGAPGEEDNPYYGYHAAFASAWALAEWRRTYSSSGEPTP